jgi:hypothetical protein
MNALTQREWLRVREALILFPVGKTKLYELMNAGLIASVKHGSRTLIDHRSLREYFASLPSRTTTDLGVK